MTSNLIKYEYLYITSNKQSPILKWPTIDNWRGVAKITVLQNIKLMLMNKICGYKL